MFYESINEIENTIAELLRVQESGTMQEQTELLDAYGVEGIDFDDYDRTFEDLIRHNIWRLRELEALQGDK